jgi:FkbM family methyltransferase
MKRIIPKKLKAVCRSLQGYRRASPIAVERAEQTFYINYLREGMVVFDVGANIGELTLLFSRFVGPSGKVYSFEASIATFEKLSGILSLSGRKNVELNHLALCDRNGLVELYVYPEEYAGWNSLANRPLESYGIDVKPVCREQVHSSTVDIFCKERGISYIDLLKIDVEGAEYQVLLGAQQAYAKT